MRITVWTLLALLLALDPAAGATPFPAGPRLGVTPDRFAFAVLDGARPPRAGSAAPAADPGGLLAAAAPRDSADSDLGPTTAPPWNPPRAIPRRRLWEQAILLPGRIATAPLSLLAEGADRALFTAEQHGLYARAANARRAQESRVGLKVSGPSLGDRTGFGATVEAHAALLHTYKTLKVSVSQSSTVRDYQATHVRLFGENFIEYDHEWRPQDRFYGLGPGSSIDSLTDVATHIQSLRGMLRYRWNRREDTGEPRTEVATWFGTRGSVTRRGREAGTSSLEERFPTISDPLLDRHVEQTVYGWRLASDWRAGSPHFRQGWRALLQAERYDRPQRWLALVTTRPGAQFTRYNAELEGTRSFGRDPRTLRLLGRLQRDDIGWGADRMLILDYARLGGRDGVAGFPPGRFHDRATMSSKLSYIFPLQRFFEMDLHVESGGVWPDLTRSPRFDQLQQSVGLILRTRSDLHPLASVGIEWSRDARRLVFTITNPER